jgi:type VI secretion system protein VasG
MIDEILTNTVLPTISREFLARTMEGRPVDRVHISVAEKDFRYGFE